jgi:hypothetical protein
MNNREILSLMQSDYQVSSEKEIINFKYSRCRGDSRRIPRSTGRGEDKLHPDVFLLRIPKNQYFLIFWRLDFFITYFFNQGCLQSGKIEKVFTTSSMFV